MASSEGPSATLLEAGELAKAPAEERPSPALARAAELAGRGTQDSKPCSTPRQPVPARTPFEERLAESKQILLKFPDRVPIYCEKSPRSDLPDLKQTKFLMPRTLPCGTFKYVIHKHLTSMVGVSADQTIYLLLSERGISPKTSALLVDIYDEYRADDGFLYMMYTAENTLGIDTRA